MPDVVILPAPVDHPDALRLIGESEAELSALYRPDVRHAFSPAQLIDAGVRFFLARDKWGAAVGCGGLAPLDGYGELKRVFVVRAVRKGGVGRALVGALEDEARRIGLRRVRLETGQASPDALALYAACGYARCGSFGSYRENGSSVFMEKRLR